MKKRKTFSIIALLLLFSFLAHPFSSCAKKQKKFEASWFEYFDTFVTVTVYADSKDEFDSYADTCQSMLKEYHELLDIYHTYEGVCNIKTLNDTEGTEPLTVDARLGEFLKFGKEMHELTNGYTNIAMGSVLALWHTARESSTLPQQQALADANEHVNINDLIISEDQTTVQKLDPKLLVDAGALGKGFVAEKISQALKEMGCHSFLLNLGGNTLAHGTKEDGSPWFAGIENVTTGDGLKGSVRISGYALVTSGSYQRYFTVDGIKYHHIIHPTTLQPENYCLSVSVLCPDSAVADALSTALFCMSVEDGMKLIQKRSDTEALWLFEDGRIQTTDGFMAHVQNGGES